MSELSLLKARSGLTIRDLAEITGINRNRVSRLLAGKGRPRPLELMCLRVVMLLVIHHPDWDLRDG